MCVLSLIVVVCSYSVALPPFGYPVGFEWQSLNAAGTLTTGRADWFNDPGEYRLSSVYGVGTATFDGTDFDFVWPDAGGADAASGVSADRLEGLRVAGATSALHISSVDDGRTWSAYFVQNAVIGFAMMGFAQLVCELFGAFMGTLNRDVREIAGR